ncbi:putative N6-adenine methyltransferase [Rhodothalassium salexigens DSM 2132]|uniref:Putative N6-adenine methyltransferase n=1 Tax=Rhodothalassium salexigens DSM 2132 TaxID=1188247 RepID=A0A4R2PA50_RHOSA|nr:hypothetical protein [Rhodothalassium salexigens]MBB4212579.1 hypothetical protein [Rhodothalassium salexigens DSM 2132]TCP31124.1 putative N6-adenine methyltransferase [Rhodothalassium salexigens DSM 2132]
MTWFTPHVARDDAFVPPDFHIGQFFYDARTARRLADALDGYRAPCCLCTPRLAAEWHRRGRTVAALDIDTRFAFLPGFRRFDLNAPTAIDAVFDAMIFDPVFQAAATLRRPVELALKASRAHGPVDLFVTFPRERESDLLASFAEFELRPLRFPLVYNNVKPDQQHRFGLYGPYEPGAGPPSVA